MELLFRLECSGEDFYNVLADRVGNDEAAELFRRNGREELGHARRVQRAIGIKLGRTYEPSGEVLERFPIELPDPSASTCSRSSSRESSTAMRAISAGPTTNRMTRSRVLLRLNGREETKHGERVSEAIAILERADAESV